MESKPTGWAFTALWCSSFLPQPSEWAALSEALHDAAGCSSWQRFHEQAALCQICRDAEAIAIISTANTPQGFEEIGESAVTLNVDASTSELGGQVLLALKKCTFAAS